MTTKSEIIEKVRKLLALSSSSNIHEAESAAKKAQEMILEYNIQNSELSIKEEGIYFEYYNIVDGRNRTVWKSTFMYFLAKHNLCRSVNSGNKIVLFGTKTNREMVKSLYEILSKQLEIICEFGFRNYKDSGGEIHGKTWKQNFYMGAITGFNDKLNINKQRFMGVMNDTSIISLHEKLVDDKVKETFNKIRKQKNSYQYHPDIYEQGRTVGKNLTSNGLLK